MAVIYATIIQQSRTLKRCSVCNQVLELGKPRIKVFGNAEGMDPPYVIYIHPGCANSDVIDKLKGVHYE